MPESFAAHFPQRVSILISPSSGLPESESFFEAGFASEDYVTERATVLRNVEYYPSS